MSSFRITTEKFEGPIDVLLRMVEKRKLPINDFSLSDIADEYIYFIQNLENESLTNKTHFIFVASTLTLIKSKSLLPSLDLTDEEEGDIEELKKRLKLLKEFQELAVLLKTNIKTKPSFYFFEPQKKEIFFQPHKNIQPLALYESLGSILRSVPEQEKQKKEGYVKIAVHIEEMMESLQERIIHASKIDFNSYMNSYTKNLTERKEVKVYQVVGFLAMLELVRKGILNVIQKDNFKNIEIENI